MLGIVAGAIVAVAGGIEALLFRRGSLRSLGQWYLDPSAPLVIRHLPFAGPPAAVFGFMVMLMSILTGLSITMNVALFSAVTLLLMAALGGAVWFMLVPPEWLKPGWLKEAEAAALRELLARERAEVVPVAAGRVEPAPFAVPPTVPEKVWGPPDADADADAGEATGEATGDEPAAADSDTDVLPAVASEAPAPSDADGSNVAQPADSSSHEPDAERSGIVAASWGASRLEVPTSETDASGAGSTSPGRIGAFLRSRRRGGS